MNLGTIIFILCMLIFFIFLSILSSTYIADKIDNKKYGKIDAGFLFEKRIDGFIGKISNVKVIERVIKNLSLQLSVFNAKSYKQNMRYATVTLSILFFALFVLSIFVTVLCWPLWYMALLYIFMFFSASCLIFIMFSSYVSYRYINYLPETLKILSSRYLSRGSIIKAISISINDFHKSIRGEMIRIYDVLKQNEMKTIKNTFDEIENKYKNEYISLMLQLIWYSHFNGGNETIKKQFDQMITDITEESENKRDLKSAATSYIVMSIGFIAAIPCVKMFNRNMLDGSELFYKSGEGILLSAVFFILIMLLVVIIIFIERTE